MVLLLEDVRFVAAKDSRTRVAKDRLLAVHLPVRLGAVVVGGWGASHLRRSCCVQTNSVCVSSVQSCRVGLHMNWVSASRCLLTWKGEAFLATEGRLFRIAEFIVETDVVGEVVQVLAIEVLAWPGLVLIALLLND